MLFGLRSRMLLVALSSSVAGCDFAAGAVLEAAYGEDGGTFRLDAGVLVGPKPSEEVTQPSQGLATLDSGAQSSANDAATQQPSANDAATQQPSANDAGSATRPDGSTPNTQPDASTARDASVADATVSRPDASVSGGQRCVIFLHGKGSAGANTRDDPAGFKYISPNGPASAAPWNGQQWLYFPDSGYNDVVAVVQKAISDNSCARVIIHGFSNGGAAAAKLYCRGNTFGGTVLGYIADDPVPDHGADSCARPAGVRLRVYWTGGLNHCVDGWECGPAEYTCEGGTTVGVNKYAANLGTQWVQSKYSVHQQYDNPPEYSSWW